MLYTASYSSSSTHLIHQILSTVGPYSTVDPYNAYLSTGLAELRSNVSKVFGLETSLAIYKDHITPQEMKFDQMYWPNGTPPSGNAFWEGYSDTFYTIKPQSNCAVVGSSGILTDSRCGKEIDSHDFVMRMNLPPLKGYEKDIGRKVNLTAVNFSCLRYFKRYLDGLRKTPPKYSDKKRYFTALQNLHDSIVWFPFNMTFDDEISTLTFMVNETLLKRNFTYRVAYARSPVWPHYMNRFWNTTGSSQGMIMLTIATLFCSKIDLYGFWPFHEDNICLKGKDTPGNKDIFVKLGVLDITLVFATAETPN
ncbi:CMP-N-acetylneuraminate-poly-alpha-2,8-sialyltransferase-like [Glandiceps talaboti]